MVVSDVKMTMKQSLLKSSLHPTAKVHLAGLAVFTTLIRKLTGSGYGVPTQMVTVIRMSLMSQAGVTPTKTCIQSSQQPFTVKRLMSLTI